MTGSVQLSRALRTIEAEMAALVADARDHPIDAHELHCLTVKVGAQAEMLEKGLVAL